MLRTRYCLPCLTLPRRVRLLEQIGYHQSLAVLLPEIVALSLGTAKVKCLERGLDDKIQTPFCTFWLPKSLPTSFKGRWAQIAGMRFVPSLREGRLARYSSLPEQCLEALQTLPLLQYGTLKHQEALRHWSIWTPVAIHLESSARVRLLLVRTVDTITTGN